MQLVVGENSLAQRIEQRGAVRRLPLLVRPFFQSTTPTRNSFCRFARNALRAIAELCFREAERRGNFRPNYKAGLRRAASTLIFSSSSSSPHARRANLTDNSPIAENPSALNARRNAIVAMG